MAHSQTHHNSSQDLSIFLTESETESEFDELLSCTEDDFSSQTSQVSPPTKDFKPNTFDNQLTGQYNTNWPKSVDLSAWHAPSHSSPHPDWKIALFPDQILTPPNQTPSTSNSNPNSWTPRSLHTSPAYAKLIMEKMHSDYDQGYPHGVKYINVTLNNHLAQLGKDLDRTWKTVQDTQDILEDEIKIRESPRRLGRLFNPLHTHELLRNLDEVTELVIGRFVLTSALSDNAMTTSEMIHRLRAGWMFFRDELMDALIAIEGLHLESLTAGTLYSQYQREIYNRIHEYHPDTLEELQVAMEQLRAKYNIRFPGEGWPVERGTEWMDLPK